LTLTFVKWQPDSGPTIIDDRFGWLSQAEARQLQGLGLSGRLIVVGHSIDQGIGLRSRLLIVMHRQVEAPVRLPLPIYGNIVYIQEQDGWRIIPPTRLRKYALRIEPYPTSEADYTDVRVERRLGVGGGTAFNWSRDYP
jgi:hypothetical protein